MEFCLPEDHHRSIREIYDYWVSINPADGAPARRDLDPVDVPKLLPNLWMANVEREPIRFRFRLIESAIVEI